MFLPGFVTTDRAWNSPDVLFEICTFLPQTPDMSSKYLLLVPHRRLQNVLTLAKNDPVCWMVEVNTGLLLGSHRTQVSRHHQPLHLPMTHSAHTHITCVIWLFTFWCSSTLFLCFPTVRDWDETTPASHPVQRLTSSEVTAASAARVTVTHSLKSAVPQRDGEGLKVVKPYGGYLPFSIWKLDGKCSSV